MIKESTETESNKILQDSYESGIDIAEQDGNLQPKEFVPYEGEPGGKIVKNDHALMDMRGDSDLSMTRTDLLTRMGIVEQCQNSDEGFNRRGSAYSFLCGESADL